MDIPEKIEDVPLRNQDRRLLNARHKRLIAKRIICFGISTSLIFLGLGIALIEIHCLFQKGKQLKNLPNKNTQLFFRVFSDKYKICTSKELLTSNIQKNPTFLGNIRGCSQTTFTRGGG